MSKRHRAEFVAQVVVRSIQIVGASAVLPLCGIGTAEQLLRGRADGLNAQRPLDDVDRLVQMLTLDQQLRLCQEGGARVGERFKEQSGHVGRIAGECLSRRKVIREGAECFRLNGDVNVRAESRTPVPHVTRIDALTGLQQEIYEAAGVTVAADNEIVGKFGQV